MVTITSITYQTVSHIATQVATVLLVVVGTSTIISTSEVIVEHAETQTNVVWMTSTTVAKRAVTTPGLPPLERENPPPSESRLSWAGALRASWGSIRGLSSVGMRLPHAVDDAGLVPRQATRQPAAAVTAASTVTKFVTQTKDITSIASVTVTTETTSYVMTTVFRTNTKYVLTPNVPGQ